MTRAMIETEWEWDCEALECSVCAESGADPETGICSECEAEQHFQTGKAKAGESR